MRQRKKPDALNSQRQIAWFYDARLEFHKTVSWRKAAHYSPGRACE
jgi:hypothetical protein